MVSRVSSLAPPPRSSSKLTRLWAASLLFRSLPSQRNYHNGTVSFSDQTGPRTHWCFIVAWGCFHPLAPSSPTQVLSVLIDAILQSRCIGSFRLAAYRLHLHSHFNFIKPIPKTASESLPHSVTTIISGQRVLLPSHGQCYRGH